MASNILNQDGRNVPTGGGLPPDEANLLEFLNVKRKRADPDHRASRSLNGCVTQCQ